MYSIKNKYSLYDHQEKVTNWMNSSESRGCGGILAVDMGLGKTLISLYHIFSNMKNAHSLSLVIVPKTLLHNWKRDGIKKFFPKVNALYYHPDIIGRKTFDELHNSFLDLNSPNSLLSYDIVITTYDVCLSMFKRKRGNFLFTVEWERIICDESQRLSNPRTSTFKALSCLESKYNWCLTGTPIRNKIKDLFTQLQFCGFGKISSYKIYHAKKLHTAVYRLNYDDTDIELPEKNVFYHHSQMDTNQRKVYESYLNGVKSHINGNTINPDYKLILEMFLRLRQICISPSMITNSGEFIKKI